jgi:hypothetical protein
MFTYEIDRKLSDKADKWEVRNCENENRHLREKINELERQNGRDQSDICQLRNALSQLFDYLVEKATEEDYNNIMDLKNRLNLY